VGPLSRGGIVLVKVRKERGGQNKLSQIKVCQFSEVGQAFTFAYLYISPIDEFLSLGIQNEL
jgi:hypothetical protein